MTEIQYFFGQSMFLEEDAVKPQQTRWWMWLVLVMGLWTLPGASRAQSVVLTPDGGNWTVTTPNYSASIEVDGCLTQINVGGQKLLAPGVNISRGTYFYKDGCLKLSAAAKTSEHSVKAEGPQAEIEYDFALDGMTWKLSNKTDEKMLFFAVLSDQRRAGKSASGPWLKDFINSEDTSSNWAFGDSKLSMSNGNRLWGPWEGKHQVVHFDLQPKESRTVNVHVGPLEQSEKAELAGLSPDPDEQDLVIRSPRDYQVIQRYSADEGALIISGRVNVPCDSVRGVVSGKSIKGDVPGEVWNLKFDPLTKAFHYATHFPAGGWYQLKVEALLGEKLVATQIVSHFGIGEVFVGAGQSNSTNSGQFKIEQTSGKVSSFSGTHWQIANDPQPGVADSSQGGSYYPAFGDLMYEKFKVPIGIASTGFGGTSVNQWQPDGDLHKWMMTRIHQLGPNGFRAVLWHQGESDIDMNTDEYYQKLKTIILASKQKAGWEFPWFVAQVSYHNPSKLSFDTTRNAQAKLWQDGVALQGPDTDTLVKENRDFDGNGIHFSPIGLKAHGNLWFVHVAPYVEAAIK